MVNKPAGMASIPNRRYPNYTLANALTGYYEMQGIPSKVHLVSRLDKQTSGLLLVAKIGGLPHLVMGQVSRRYVFFGGGADGRTRHPDAANCFGRRDDPTHH